MTGRSRTWLAMVAVLLLTSCSGTTFLYNRLGYIIPWYVERYVDLDRQQKAFLKGELEPFLAWHRNIELPYYLELLSYVETTTQQPLTQESVRELYDRTSVIFDRLNAESVTWSIALGEKLDDEQLDEFMENLREKQLEYEEEYLPRSDEDYLQENIEEIIESFESFLGKLTKEQRATVAIEAPRLQRWDRLWLENRQQWLDDLAELLRREPGWQQRTLDMVAMQDKNFSEEYNAVFEHNIDVICALVAEVGNLRTEKQDRKARRKLAGYIEDVQTLIAQGQ